MKRRVAAGAATLAVAMAVTSHAGAGAVPLSALPRLGTIADGEKGPLARIQIPGAWVDKVAGTTVPVHAKDDLCIYVLESYPRTDLTITHDATVDQKVDFLRLQETDGSATLERTRVVVDAKGFLLVARQRQALAKLPGDARWSTSSFAYREGDDVIVLTTTSSTASVTIVRRDQEDFPGGVTDCAFAMARLPVKNIARGGAVGQVFGKTRRALPTGAGAEPTNFVLNLSLAKIGRDPEPFLSAGLRAE